MTIKNPLLQKAYQAIQEKTQDQAAFQKIVDAGTRVIYDKNLFPQLAQGIRESKDPVETVAEGMIGILGILYKQSRNTMPAAPMISAGMALLLDALDFIEQAGLVKIDQKELARATKFYVNSLLPKVGLTPEKMGATLQQLQGVMNDPAKMAAYKGA